MFNHNYISNSGMVSCRQLLCNCHISH
uniref:Uncharacterized protein n=2 Tax=Anguilla anguilla TaxID=7936 RepID=A0A0E9V4J1_ANGAN